jgi:hypothetical protein
MSRNTLAYSVLMLGLPISLALLLFPGIYLTVSLYSVPVESVYLSDDGSSMAENNVVLIGFRYVQSILILSLIGLTSGVLGGLVIYQRVDKSGQKQVFRNAVLLSALTIILYLGYAALINQLNGKELLIQVIVLFSLLLPVTIRVTVLFTRRLVKE